MHHGNSPKRQKRFYGLCGEKNKKKNYPGVKKHMPLRHGPS